MKRCVIAVLLLAGPLAAPAQTNALDLQDLVNSAAQWAQENLDTNVLNALQNADQEKVQQFLDDLLKRLQGDYVVDMASVRPAAKIVLPLLESYEETAPYAVWLKTRLDYLDVAEDLRLATPPPKVQPGQPPPPVPNPAPEKEREIWVKKIAERPWPKEAQDYVPKLKPVFAAQQVPPELVWVAEVESSFDPRARSPAGASGLFQLMPATAKRYGLSMFPWDQRRQTEPSARAAAQYLSYLHGRFQDWRLALAAYNSGEGTVQKLLDRYKTRSFDRIATHLPAETQMFVPKVEATLRQREGVELAKLPGPRG
jgi:membrane-bound lytic murein transglycosylase D